MQHRHGSIGFYDRKRVEGKAVPGNDALTEKTRNFAKNSNAADSPRLRSLRSNEIALRRLHR